MLFNTAIRMVYPFLPVFARGLGIDLQNIALLLSLRFGLGVLSPFFTSAADQHDRKINMLLGLGMFTLSMAGMLFWPGYLTFILALILSLIGNILFITAMQAYLGEHVPYERRGLVLSLTELSWSASFFLGVPLIGLAINRAGWQAPFPILAGLGLLAFVVTLVFIPSALPIISSHNGMRQNLRAVFSSRTALAAIGLGMAISSSNELVNLILGVWIEDSFGVKIAALAGASMVIGIAELFGEGFSGGLTDRLGKSRAVALGLLLNSLSALLLPFLGRSISGALFGLFLLYLTFEFTIVSSIPLMTEVLPAARATMMAGYIASNTMGRALSDLVSPLLYRQQWGPASGILLICLASVSINLLALGMLRYVSIIERPRL